MKIGDFGMKIQIEIRNLGSKVDLAIWFGVAQASLIKSLLVAGLGDRSMER